MNTNGAINCRKPQTTIGRMPSCRLKRAGCFAALHPVFGTIHRALQCGNKILLILIKLIFFNGEDSIVGTHPKCLVAVLQNLIDAILKQTVLRSERCEFAVSKS